MSVRAVSSVVVSLLKIAFIIAIVSVPNKNENEIDAILSPFQMPTHQLCHFRMEARKPRTCIHVKRFSIPGWKFWFEHAVKLAVVRWFVDRHWFDYERTRSTNGRCCMSASNSPSDFSRCCNMRAPDIRYSDSDWKTICSLLSASVCLCILPDLITWIDCMQRLKFNSHIQHECEGAVSIRNEWGI